MLKVLTYIVGGILGLIYGFFSVIASFSFKRIIGLIAYILSKIGNLAMMSQSKDYIKGSVMVSLIFAIPMMFWRRGYFLEMFLSCMFFFVLFWAIGFGIVRLFGLKDSFKVKEFKHTGWSQAFLVPVILLWSLLLWGKGGAGHAFFILAIVSLFFKAPVLAANVVLQSCLLVIGIGAFMNGAVTDDADISGVEASDGIMDGDPIITSTPDIPPVDVAASPEGIDGLDGMQGIEQVDAHHREGTWVDGHWRNAGEPGETWVDGHWREGGPVQEHIRTK